MILDWSYWLVVNESCWPVNRIGLSELFWKEECVIHVLWLFKISKKKPLIWSSLQSILLNQWAGKEATNNIERYLIRVSTLIVESYSAFSFLSLGKFYLEKKRRFLGTLFSSYWKITRIPFFDLRGPSFINFGDIWSEIPRK